MAERVALWLSRHVCSLVGLLLWMGLLALVDLPGWVALLASVVAGCLAGRVDAWVHADA